MIDLILCVFSVDLSCESVNLCCSLRDTASITQEFPMEPLMQEMSPCFHMFFIFHLLLELTLGMRQRKGGGGGSPETLLVFWSAAPVIGAPLTWQSMGCFLLH